MTSDGDDTTWLFSLPLLREAMDDPYYRYTMPRPLVRFDGGDANTTLLINLQQVAKALGRPLTYLIKFLKYELKVKVKAYSKDTYTLSGYHSSETLIDLLYKFIKLFVLCSRCKNPETSLFVEDAKVHLECLACGNDVIMDDRKHKLIKFIREHGPKRVEEKEVEVYHFATNDENNNTLLFEDDDKEVELRSVIKRLKKDLAQNANAQKELVAEAERLELLERAPLILYQELLRGHERILDEIKAYQKCFLRFCHDNSRAQRHLLYAFEEQPQQQKQLVKVLKAFYDEDILDEETLLEWYADMSEDQSDDEEHALLCKQVAPFIKWLKEADEEE